MTVLDTAPPQTRASWAGVVSLGLGIFAIVMSEFLPASLLPRIAGDLGVTPGAAGQSVTVTAFAAAAAALFLSAVLPHTDRRRVLIGLTALAVVSNVLVALAPNLGVLLAARILLGLALGGFWAMAAAVTAHLVPAEKIGRALTIVNSGTAVATVAAVPLGTWPGEAWGWRAVFLLAAAVAVLALLIQAVTLPRITPDGTGSLRSLAATLRSGVVLGGLAAVLLIFSGHFSGFTYIRPAAESVSGVDAGGLALLLLVFGVANLLGTALAGPLADRALRTAVLVFPVLLGAGMLLMLSTGGSTAGLFLAAALWGFGFGGIPTTVLTWGARTAPDRLEQIGGLVVTACNIAIGLGALVGGILVDGVSASAPLLAGGVVAILGGLVLGNARARR